MPVGILEHSCFPHMQVRCRQPFRPTAVGVDASWSLLPSDEPGTPYSRRSDKSQSEPGDVELMERTLTDTAGYGGYPWAVFNFDCRQAETFSGITDETMLLMALLHGLF